MSMDTNDPGTELDQLTEEAAGVVEEASAGGETGKGLRAQLEASQAELRQFKDRALDEAFQQNGLSRTEGIGKAFNEIYDGEPTAAALEAFLQTEYGYEYQGEGHPMARQIAAEQSKLDQLSSHAGSVALPSEATRLQDAEARGNYQETLRLKAGEMQGWFRGPQQ